MTGEIGIDLFSVNPVETTAAGSLVTIAMHVRDTADVGATGLSFVTEVNPNGHRAFQTMVEDAQGSLVLHIPMPLTGLAPAAPDVAMAHDEQLSVVNEQWAPSNGPKAVVDQVFGQMPDVSNPRPLPVSQFPLMDQIFVGLEEQFLWENTLAEFPTASWPLPPAGFSDEGLAQQGLAYHDCVSADLVACLGRVGRVARYSRHGESLDNLPVGQDESDVWTML